MDRLRKFTLLTFSAVISVWSLSSCFTGIESTPKITANDVRKQKAFVTEEQKFLADLTPEPFAQWTNGKEFYITDDKIQLIFNAATGNVEGLAGNIMRYFGYNPVMGIDGDTITDLMFSLPGAQGAAVYRVNNSPSDLRTKGVVEVPFTVDLSMVNSAAAVMEGKTYYTVTSLWYDSLERAIHGRKYVPVQVVSVTPGNHVYPIKVKIKDEKGEDAYLMMSIGKHRSSTRNFDMLFSFTDPHLQYPSILEENWTAIQNGLVRQYMTQQEARLAMGSPKRVDRHPSTSTLTEIWYYENGRYLVFEDGLLQRYRM